MTTSKTTSTPRGHHPLLLLAILSAGLGSACAGTGTEGGTPAVAAPSASFTFAPAAPTAGQAVSFTDASTGAPSAWAWAFGDGATSTAQHPSHTYAASGTFTVTLVASNASGSGTASRSVTVAGGPGGGPTACTAAADCAVAGACPAGAALGCACAPTPSGDRCVPQCATSADCPSAPDKTLTCTAGLCVGAGGGGGTGDGVMDITDTISDQAQAMTIAFDGLAFVTGSFCAQTFYPPGKVADFFGFQYLRDNDPSGLGHNTEFTTLSADPVLAAMTSAQIETFVDLAVAEHALADAYGLARFPLARAFRRLLDGETPSGHGELSREAVKAYSGYLFTIDGQMSLLRARAYASVLGSMNATQLGVLSAMKGHGAAEWTQPASPPAALTTYRQYSVELRTYAGEMFAWYAGSLAADTYFCPERQGTYFGSFFMKDVKAMHNPSYTIDSNMTADMGDAFLATLDTAQREAISGLTAMQKADLVALVAKREQISAALRGLTAAGGTVDEAAVLELARQYGELDGDISYSYATRFSAVGRSLTTAQVATLTALRKQATAETDGSADYDLTCGNGFLYSAPLSSAPVIMDTDFMFGVCGDVGASCASDWGCCSYRCTAGSCTAPFTFSSSAFVDGGRLPQTYTCDGTSVSPPLGWSGAPAGTVEYALTLTTEALDGTKYNWVLYGIPAGAVSLSEATSGVGTAGVSTDGPELRYYAPCSTGPGDKLYTFTLHALSGSPALGVPASGVTGPVLEAAIAPLVLSTRRLAVTYARAGG